MYLAAAGIGTLVLGDDDRVDLSNLQRQIVHNTQSIGQLKTESARATLRKLNPGTKVELLEGRLGEAAMDEAVHSCQAVVDCTDNFRTRFALNRACWRAGVPLVSGAAIRMEGQLSVFDPRNAQSPCYHCLYEEDGELDLSCSTNGVMAPLVGMVGSMQALETSGYGTPLVGRLLLVDAAGMHLRELKIAKRPGCEVCGG